jgi:putative Mg2+ transporter-C (MgtC) family protein
VIQAIAIGIGFLGSGVIFKQQVGVAGLTTAAGLWVAAAIGMAIGASLYYLAVFATFLTFLVFTGFGLAERRIIKADDPEENK